MTNFDPEHPPLQDLTSLEWAAWTFCDRTLAKNLTLAQVQARLVTHQRVVDGTVYYRPFAAAAEYVTRPDQMIERNRNELTDKYIDPFKVAAEWKALQAQLDLLIPASASAEQSGSGTGEFTGDLDFRGWG